MLQIEIEGKSVFIPTGTKIQLEVNNSIFDTEKIAGDIIFTFDLPADKNDIIFQHARYVYIQRKKSYAAKIKVGGFAIADGTLIVQNSTLTKYSCGIVVNPYPAGFADRLLKDNDYGDEGQLGNPSTDILEIYRVIVNSLNPDSNLKFGEFVDWEYYGKDKDYYDDPDNKAYFKGSPNQFVVLDNAITPGYPVVWSQNFTGRYINLAPYNGIIVNMFALSASIKLIFLLKMVLKVAGYKLVGEITRNEISNRLFYHSFRDIDSYPDDVNDPYYSRADANRNLFTSDIPLGKHTPNLTNSELINTICDLLGCTYYINSQTREIEMSFAKDLKDTKHIDLTKYLLNNETKIERTESKSISYQLGSILEEDFDETDIIGEVNYYSDLQQGYPPTPLTPGRDYKEYAEISKGKIFFVKYLNAFCRSVQNENVDDPYWYWEKFCGNTKTLSINTKNAEEKTELFPKAKIPIFRAASGYALDFSNHQCISQIFNKETEDFELILNYYRGETRGTSSYGYYTYTKMSPLAETVIDEFNLTVDGDDSLGSVFIKPYINLLQNYEPVTEQFLFPLHVFLEVWQLLKPQNIETSHQKRWIMVDNIKYLPIQMKFEFTEGKPLIKSEIKMAKPVVQTK
jgi:hypothetical protein